MPDLNSYLPVHIPGNEMERGGVGWGVLRGRLVLQSPDRVYVGDVPSTSVWPKLHDMANEFKVKWQPFMSALFHVDEHTYLHAFVNAQPYVTFSLSVFYFIYSKYHKRRISWVWQLTGASSAFSRVCQLLAHCLFFAKRKTRQTLEFSHEGMNQWYLLLCILLLLHLRFWMKEWRSKFQRKFV